MTSLASQCVDISPFSIGAGRDTFVVFKESCTFIFDEPEFLASMAAGAISGRSNAASAICVTFFDSAVGVVSPITKRSCCHTSGSMQISSSFAASAVVRVLSIASFTIDITGHASAVRAFAIISIGAGFNT
jgi:hypothetical protein